jgi:LPXTG-site transpeptidase (sortase) family protein
MRLRIQPANARAQVATCLRLSRWVSLAGAGIFLGWPTAIWVDSQLAQWSGARELERQMLAAAQAPPHSAKRMSQEGEAVVPDRSNTGREAMTKRGAVLGRLDIPRLKMNYVVLEGTDAHTLDRSIGHIPHTALPGQKGNIGIAGHRNTHFKRLEWIRRNDEIVLTSPQGKFRYRAEWVSLFEPEDLQVLDASHGPALTLITCFPFEYVGNAPLRFVVRALPDEQTRSRLQPAPKVAAGD